MDKLSKLIATGAILVMLAASQTEATEPVNPGAVNNNTNSTLVIPGNANNNVNKQVTAASGVSGVTVTQNSVIGGGRGEREESVKPVKETVAKKETVSKPVAPTTQSVDATTQKVYIESMHTDVEIFSRPTDKYRQFATIRDLKIYECVYKYYSINYKTGERVRVQVLQDGGKWRLVTKDDLQVGTAVTKVDGKVLGPVKEITTTAEQIKALVDAASKDGKTAGYKDGYKKGAIDGRAQGKKQALDTSRETIAAILGIESKDLPADIAKMTPEQATAVRDIAQTMTLAQVKSYLGEFMDAKAKDIAEGAKAGAKSGAEVGAEKGVKKGIADMSKDVENAAYRGAKKGAITGTNNVTYVVGTGVVISSSALALILVVLHRRRRELENISRNIAGIKGELNKAFTKDDD
jgi:hypothetical protein